MGFIGTDPYAHELMVKLAREAVTTANADIGANFDADRVIADIETVLKNSSGGYTSIYADIKNGAKTEVDTISGYVISTAQRLGIPVPCHETVVAMIHAMENKAKQNIS